MAFIRASKQGISALGIATVLLLAPHRATAKAKPEVQAQINDARRPAPAVQELPGSGSQLPLLSFIGLGMISGGLISVTRTRPRKQAAS